MILVRSTSPEESTLAKPKDARCDRCGAGGEGDLRLLVFRGKTRYAERTVCDVCAEELLELFLDTPSPVQAPAPVVRVLRARVKTGKHDEFWHHVRTTMLPPIATTDGLLSYFPGEPLSESDEFVVVTLWRNFEALLAWAGDDWETPVLGPAAMELVDEAAVSHYALFDAPPGLLASGGG